MNVVLTERDGVSFKVSWAGDSFRSTEKKTSSKSLKTCTSTSTESTRKHMKSSYRMWWWTLCSAVWWSLENIRGSVLLSKVTSTALKSIIKIWSIILELKCMKKTFSIHLGLTYSQRMSLWLPCLKVTWFCSIKSLLKRCSVLISVWRSVIPEKPSR